MMGVREGTVHTTFVVNGQPRSGYKLPGIVLENTTLETPKSRLYTTVTLGLSSTITSCPRSSSRRARMRSVVGHVMST